MKFFLTGALKYADSRKNKEKIILAFLQPLTGGRNLQISIFRHANLIWSKAACTEFKKIVLWVTKYPNEHTNLVKIPIAPSHPLTGGSNPYK